MVDSKIQTISEAQNLQHIHRKLFLSLLQDGDNKWRYLLIYFYACTECPMSEHFLTLISSTNKATGCAEASKKGTKKDRFVI